MQRTMTPYDGKRRATRRPGAAGYTLIEIAFAIVILGVLTAPLLVAYDLYRKDQVVRRTYMNVDGAVAALGEYWSENGFYPCPAPMKAARSGPAYGHPLANCATNPDLTPPTAVLSPGECTDGSVGTPPLPAGICIEESVRLGLADRRVIVGALPFRLLQMDEKDTLDGYGSRLLYAVTVSLTDRVTFDEQNGGISVRDENGGPVTEPDGTIPFIVISHGAGRLGAYSSEGVLHRACDDDPSNPTETQNCNVGFETGAAAAADSIYTAAPQSLAANSSFYDDVVSYFSQKTSRLWRRTPLDIEDIRDLSPNFVGIGTNAPVARLHIQAGQEGLTEPPDPLRVWGAAGNDGTIYADKLCNADGTRCFETKKLTGDNAAPMEGMKCPAGQYMVGIEAGEPKCASVLDIQCPGPGDSSAKVVFKGRSPSDGKAICATLPSPPCPAGPVAVGGTGCASVTVNLPSRPEGHTTSHYGPSEAGGFTPGSNAFNPGPYSLLSPSHPSIKGCRRVQFRCSAGSWAIHSGFGQCNFTSVPTGSTISCSAAGPWWSGTYTSTTTSRCLGSAGPVTTFSTSCVCTPGSYTDSQICRGFDPPGPTPPYASVLSVTGTVIRTRTIPSGCSAVSSTTYDTSGCSCSTPSDGVTVKWVPNGTCPAGHMPHPVDGPPEKEMTFNTSLHVCNWIDTGATRGSCVCDTTPVYQNVPHVCADTVCETPLSPDIYEVPINPVTCTPAAVAPAPPSSLHTAGSCSPKVFAWGDQGSTGTVGDPSAPGTISVGQSCGCADYNSGTLKTCYVPGDSSNMIHRCKCL